MNISATGKLVIATILMHVFLAFVPETGMIVYQDYLFAGLRWLYDFSLGFLPFAFVYVVVIWIGYWFVKKCKELLTPGHNKISLRLKGFLTDISSGLIILVCLFYWVWGFNYYQKSLSSRLKLEEVLIDSSYIREELTHVIPRLNALRAEINPDEINTLTADSFCNMESTLRKYQETVLPQLGWRPVGQVRVRKLSPEGFLLGWSTSGIYIPFSFEGHVDPGLHPLQYPFTLAHEMAHGYGVTNEGDCNTIALLTCLHSGQPLYQYAALLTYFRYLWFDPRWDEAERKNISGKISPAVRDDLVAIKNQADKFPDFLPEWRDLVYESYLHWMGVDDGLDSYHSVVDKMASLYKQYPAITNKK